MRRVIIIVVSCTVALGTSAFQKAENPSPAGEVSIPQPSSTSAEEKRQIFANGLVEGHRREATLRFEIAGRLISVDVQEGQTVHQGQTLARLDPETWNCELEKAEASLTLALAERERLVNGSREETRALGRAQRDVAKARLDQAEKRLQRGIQLKDARALAQQNLDDLQAETVAARSELDAFSARADEIEAPARPDDLRMADAKIALEKSRVRQAQASLAKTELKAPFDGIILRVRGEPGEIDTNADSASIIMADPSETRVRAFIEELDALAVVPGQRAFVTVDGLKGVRFPATLVSAAPYMSPKRIFNNTPGERADVKVREVVLVLDQEDRLVVGLPVNVVFEATTTECNNN